jgi:hypothetical protein
MPMSTICNATVRSKPHHGTWMLDFDQTVHPLYAQVAAGQPGAPDGCCLAMTMAWFDNWKISQFTPFAVWMTQPNGGYQIASLAVPAIFNAAGANWSTTVTNLLQPGRGYVAAGGFQWGPDWTGIVNHLPPILKLARYTFLGYTLNAMNHVFGVLRAGSAIQFFDSNQGGVHFPTAEDFSAWFYEYMMHGHNPRTRPRLYRLQFN